jgi:Flp pilus assembly protein TadD
MTNKSRMQQFEELLAQMPEDVELRYSLAMEHVSAGDDAGAVRRFEELIQVDPKYPPAYHQAGRALARLGRVPEARAILQRGIPVARAQGNDHAAGEMADLLGSLEG